MVTLSVITLDLNGSEAEVKFANKDYSYYFIRNNDKEGFYDKFQRDNINS